MAKYFFGLPVAGVFRFWSSHAFVFPERGTPGPDGGPHPSRA